MTLHVSSTTRPVRVNGAFVLTPSPRNPAPAHRKAIACFVALLGMGYNIAYARRLAGLYLSA